MGGADEIRFRLTALPPWLMIHPKAELRKICLDPARHDTPEFLANRAAWRDWVRGAAGDAG